MSYSFTYPIRQAKLITITQFKKLRFELTEYDYNNLGKFFNERFPNDGKMTLIDNKGIVQAKSPLYLSEETKRFYVDVTPNNWQKSDKDLVKLQEKVGKEMPVKVKIEFYQFEKNGVMSEGMCVRLIELDYFTGVINN